MNEKEKIYEIVKNHFSLSSESESKFKERLFEPVIDDTYKKFGLDENNRKYWKIKEEDLHLIDGGWFTFKNYFPLFCEKFKVSYSDFRENKVSDEKNNRMKIKKALVKFYLENPENTGRSTVANLAGKFDQFEEYLRLREENPNFLEENYVPYYFHTPMSKVANGLGAKASFEEAIENIIRVELEETGAKKLPKKDLYLVLSLNFTDWFFCSSGEKWSSCLSLCSEYSYWAGLPGLITDTNRAMIYMTDLTKKAPLKMFDKYKDIEADKIIARAWVSLLDGGKIIVNNFYPQRLLECDSINKITNSSDFVSIERNCGAVSKNEFELLYHYNGNSTTIYFDNSCLEKTKRDFSSSGEIRKFKNVFGSYSGTFSFSLENEEFIEEDIISSFYGGLPDLISYRRALSEYLVDIERSTYCSCCGEYFYGEGYVFGDEDYCENCYFEEFTECVNCREIIRYEDAFTSDEGNTYCEDCYLEEFPECDGCGQNHKKEDLIFLSNYDMSFCESCLENNFTVCEECDYYIKNDEIVEDEKGRELCGYCLEKAEEKTS